MKHPFGGFLKSHYIYNIFTILYESSLYWSVKILFYALIMWVSVACSLTLHTVRNSFIEYYDNGNIRNLVKVTEQRSKPEPLKERYRRTQTEYIEFYPNGTLKTKWKQVAKAGDSAGPCYHVRTIKYEYAETGKKCYYFRSRCDNEKIISRSYNETGKKMNTQVFKRHRWE